MTKEKAIKMKANFLIESAIKHCIIQTRNEIKESSAAARQALLRLESLEDKLKLVKKTIGEQTNKRSLCLIYDGALSFLEGVEGDS